jgi:hypothetical protein
MLDQFVVETNKETVGVAVRVPGGFRFFYSDPRFIPTCCEFDSRRGFPRGEKSESMTPGIGGRDHGVGDRFAGGF